MGDDFEPSGHDRDRIDGVAGEEEWHGEYLADAHEAFARFDEAGEHEREGREDRRAEHHGEHHSGDGRGRPVELDAHRERHQVDDRPLRERTHSCRDRFAEHERAAWRGAGEQLLKDAEVALPDDADAEEDRDEEHALGEDARREKAEVVELAGRHGVQSPEDLSENQQPERGLDRARENFRRVAAQLDQLRGDDGPRVAQEYAEAESVSPAAWPCAVRGRCLESWWCH